MFFLPQDMRDTTIPLDSEPKYYPIEVLLKNQNQELPEDVNPAKKEVSGWRNCVMLVEPSRRKAPSWYMAQDRSGALSTLNRHLNYPGAQAKNPGLLLDSFFSPPTSIHPSASLHPLLSISLLLKRSRTPTTVPAAGFYASLKSVPHITTNRPLLQQMTLFYISTSMLPTALWKEAKVLLLASKPLYNLAPAHL